MGTALNVARKAGRSLMDGAKKIFGVLTGKMSPKEILKSPAAILIIVALCAFIVIISKNNMDANTSKTASKSAETISSSTSIQDGAITVEDTVYEMIRQKLREAGINPESYYLGKNDFCQDGSGKTYLEKMVQAEIVSNYPDTGIGDIKGIIKIQRNGNPLTYINLTDFENKVSSANTSQNEADVNALNGFYSIDDSWNIIVATSNKTTVTVNNGPTTTTYNVTTNPINYQMLVSQYTIPFEFLFVLMQITNNPEYVSAVSDLALKGEIILNIMDSTTTETITESYEWTEETVTETSDPCLTQEEAAVAALVYTSTTPLPETEPEKTTTVNSMTTVEAKITYAGTWAYEKVATYTSSTTKSEEMKEKTELEKESRTLNDTTKTSTSGSEFYREKTTLNIIDREISYTVQTNISEWVLNSTTEEINTKKFLGLWRNKDGKYISPYSTEYKDGINNYVTEEDGGKEVKYQSPEDKSYKIPIRNIINEYDSADIFFYHLSLNERTQKIETLMRYMLYKYTGKDYGVTDEDLASLLSVFQEGEFYSIDGSFVGDSLEAKLWFALKGAGFSDEAVAGAVGNLAYESGGLNASAVESNGVGIGLAQWSYDRRTALEAYAASKKTSWNDENIQIEFLITEITGSGAAKDYAEEQFMDKSYKGKTYNKETWEYSSSVDEATIAFCVSWERPADPEYSLTKTPYKSRIQYAEEIYNRYHGKTFGGTPGDGNGVISSTFTSGINGKTFRIFNQNAITGWGQKCNRAAAISIASAYENKTPQELIDNINACGDGIPFTTSKGNQFFNQYGLEISPQNTNNHVAALSAQLRSGGYAMIHVKKSNEGGFVGKSGKKWTSNMHWVSIIGYKNENGTEEIYIADPNNDKLTGWFDIDEFEKNQSGFVNYLIFVSEK